MRIPVVVVVGAILAAGGRPIFAEINRLTCHGSLTLIMIVNN
jgi:hypothetical protein